MVSVTSGYSAYQLVRRVLNRVVRLNELIEMHENERDLNKRMQIQSDIFVVRRDLMIFLNKLDLSLFDLLSYNMTNVMPAYFMNAARKQMIQLRDKDPNALEIYKRQFSRAIEDYSEKAIKMMSDGIKESKNHIEEGKTVIRSIKGMQSKVRSVSKSAQDQFEGQVENLKDAIIRYNQRQQQQMQKKAA